MGPGLCVGRPRRRYRQQLRRAGDAAADGASPRGGLGRRELTLAPVVLRPATAADADLLLDWANDPETRAASIHRETIDRPTHLAWLAPRLTSPDCRIWIGTSPAGTPVGVVRFERDADGLATASISVDAGQRGRGYGHALLASGVSAAQRELRASGVRAWIRAENAASIRLFEGLGFHRVESAAAPAPGDVIEYRLEGGESAGS